jgi:hypothetical protein
MAAALYMCPLSLIVQWFTNIGLMANGGSVSTFVAGTVSTPVTTYTDSTGIVANPNPMTLSSSGRPVSASGAPVAFWVPSGTVVKFVAFDVAGNQLDVLDNVAALDDPSALLAIFANPAGGSGADLVANAVRSYDTFPSVRAAPVPNLTGNQTLVIDVEGGLTSGDSLAGIFYWSPTSLAADDGILVLQPNAILSANPGRYLRQKQSGYSGNVVVTLTGVVGTVQTTAVYDVVENIVYLRIPQVNGVSNSTSLGLSIPATAGLAPFQAQWFTVSALEDNGAAVFNQVGSVAPAVLNVFGVTFLKNGSATGFTNGGTKGVSDGGGGQLSIVISWQLN